MAGETGESPSKPLSPKALAEVDEILANAGVGQSLNPDTTLNPTAQRDVDSALERAGADSLGTGTSKEVTGEISPQERQNVEKLRKQFPDVKALNRFLFELGSEAYPEWKKQSGLSDDGIKALQELLS